MFPLGPPLCCTVLIVLASLAWQLAKCCRQGEAPPRYTYPGPPDIKKRAHFLQYPDWR